MSVSRVKDPIDWEALRLFLAVARAAGLAGAARQTGISAPTLGRQMTALERRINQRLFERRRLDQIGRRRRGIVGCRGTEQAHRGQEGGDDRSGSG